MRQLKRRKRYERCQRKRDNERQGERKRGEVREKREGKKVKMS